MTIVITCCLGDYMKSNIDFMRKSFGCVTIVGVDCADMSYNFVGVDCFERVPFTEDDNYVDALLDVCKRYEADVLLPTSALDIKVIMPRIKEFDCVVALGNTPGTEISNDKKRFIDFSLSHSINITPYSAILSSKAELQKYVDEHGSAFVKFPYGKRTLTVTDNVDDVKEFPCIAQKIMTGREYSCVCLCSHGEPFASFVARNDKMCGGTAMRATIVDNKRIERMCEHACKELMLDGIAEFDLMEDEKGDVYIIECNPRITATVSLFCAGGIDVIGRMIRYYKTGKFESMNGAIIRYGVSIQRFREDVFFSPNGWRMSYE